MTRLVNRTGSYANETALTTAKVFFREIVARFSLPEIIFSDRAMSFMSSFMSRSVWSRDENDGNKT